MIILPKKNLTAIFYNIVYYAGRQHLIMQLENTQETVDIVEYNTCKLKYKNTKIQVMPHTPAV